MSGQSKLPVSRTLVQMVRECSRLTETGQSLSEHMRAVDERHSQGVEFYLRACAQRLEHGV
jgi:hypothetical protein